jgi:hypothetical protein
MLHLDLHIQPQTEERLKKVLASTSDEEMFAQNFIAYQVAEFQKGAINIRLDLKQFEEKYHQTTEQFYQPFEQGHANDTEDAMLWAGLYEMLQDNERRLQELT